MEALPGYWELMYWECPLSIPQGRKSFFVRDPFENIFHIVEATDWFMNLKKDIRRVIRSDNRCH
ncbi:MAG: hypothetical protein MZV63_54565 [Marinilabiliales bacterium]|nr:hypothetical protein [Marinilabiliales bacterium]